MKDILSLILGEIMIYLNNEQQFQLLLIALLKVKNIIIDT